MSPDFNLLIVFVFRRGKNESIKEEANENGDLGLGSTQLNQTMTSNPSMMNRKPTLRNRVQQTEENDQGDTQSKSFFRCTFGVSHTFEQIVGS